jgi:hypothetical protein
MSRNRPLLGRFLSTAALASVMVGLLLSYQWGHAAGPSMAQVVAPASPEMMQLLRDEHGLVATMLKAQLATEKRELAAGGTDRPGAAEAGTPLRVTLAR